MHDTILTLLSLHLFHQGGKSFLKEQTHFRKQNAIQGVPHLRGFHYHGSHYLNFWLMYAQVGDFHVNALVGDLLQSH